MMRVNGGRFVCSNWREGHFCQRQRRIIDQYGRMFTDQPGKTGKQPAQGNEGYLHAQS